MSNYRGAVEASLVCPKCGAANRPGCTYVAWDARAQTASCIVCSHTGKIEEFQRKEHPCS